MVVGVAKHSAPMWTPSSCLRMTAYHIVVASPGPGSGATARRPVDVGSRCPPRRAAPRGDLTRGRVDEEDSHRDRG